MSNAQINVLASVLSLLLLRRFSSFFSSLFGSVGAFPFGGGRDGIGGNGGRSLNLHIMQPVCHHIGLRCGGGQRRQSHWGNQHFPSQENHYQFAIKMMVTQISLYEMNKVLINYWFN